MSERTDRRRVGWAVLALGLLWAPVAAAVAALLVSATPAASALQLDGQGSASTHIVKVARLDVTGVTGFTLTVTSGQLSTAEAATSVDYQVTTVVADAPPPAGSAFTTASGSNLVYTGSGNTSLDLYIKYTPLALQDPGTYTASAQVNVTEP